MNAATGAKIKMLENSMQCYVCGLLGLLPVIGLPFAVAALLISVKVRAGEKKHWNATRSYWISGVAYAIGGTVLWGFILTLIIYYR